MDKVIPNTVCKLGTHGVAMFKTDGLCAPFARTSRGEREVCHA